MLGMAQRDTLGMRSGVTRWGSDKVGTSWTADLSAFSRAAAGGSLFRLQKARHLQGQRACKRQWRSDMGVEPTQDESIAPQTVLKTAAVTGPRAAPLPILPRGRGVRSPGAAV